jgi:hypothetical protein
MNMKQVAPRYNRIKFPFKARIWSKAAVGLTGESAARLLADGGYSVSGSVDVLPAEQPGIDGPGPRPDHCQSCPEDS